MASGEASPVGMAFMEKAPDGRIPGSYDEKLHLWVDADGKPALLDASTATGSNASTGASNETDMNEDFD